MPEQLVNLNPFNIRKACDRNYNALVIGKRGTGKSTVISDILYIFQIKKKSRGCAFLAVQKRLTVFIDSLYPPRLYTTIPMWKSISR